MPEYDIALLLKRLTDEDANTRKTAREAILALDEDAVTPLIDAFYAGVNQATGTAIIQLMSAIGGYEARQLLEDVLYFPQPYPIWQTIAQQGMVYNGWHTN